LGARLFVDNITAPPKAMPTLNTTDITTRSAAGTSITEVDENIASVTQARASLGASINRIYHAADNLAQRAHHIAESRSDMVDTDYAEATMHLSRLKALDVGASFVLQQSRQNSQNALGMIRSNDTFFRN
jgi:flagellin